MKSNNDKIIKFAYHRFNSKKWSKRELEAQYNKFLETGAYENIVNFMKYIGY